MGVARLLLQNLIPNAAALTVSSERSGPVGTPAKTTGTGSATAESDGLYSGIITPRQYLVEIDSIGGGTEIGQARFRWRPADQASWSASGVLTSATFLALEFGIKVKWTGGSGNDFAVGDAWTIIVEKPFGKAMLLDRDRDTEFRSLDASVLVRVEADLGTSQTINAVALLDHNVRSTATLTIKGNSSASWASPPLSESISWKARNVIRYLTTTPRSYRYWALELTDTGNPDGYLAASEIFLGGYLALSQNFDRGWRRGQLVELYGGSSRLRLPRGVWARTDVVELDYRLIAAADRDQLLTAFQTVYDQDRGTVQPFLLNFDSDDPADISLYEWQDPSIYFFSPFLGRFDGPLRLIQRPRLARRGS